MNVSLYLSVSSLENHCDCRSAMPWVCAFILFLTKAAGKRKYSREEQIASNIVLAASCCRYCCYFVCQLICAGCIRSGPKPVAAVVGLYGASYAHLCLGGFVGFSLETRIGGRCSVCGCWSGFQSGHLSVSISIESFAMDQFAIRSNTQLAICGGGRLLLVASFQKEV
ncbi:hypothetical protein C8N47_106103 [Mangrovibacterium marinum]|uniref:Uncharacterized protein n=1 Tax=Mangrovibacterium marinum TaxID=1639118 RepID=A0A2T5C2N6_9BACT|nr:hypothetical protein C8N47_106103 [Mangrovibacterium marinum]